MSNHNPQDRETAMTRRQTQLPRTQWSNLTDEEFLRFAEREQASEELVSEYRARLWALVYANGVRGAR